MKKIIDGYESNLMGSVEVSDLETWQPKRLVIQYQFHLVGLSEIGLVDPSFHSFQFHINFIRIGMEPRLVLISKSEFWCFHRCASMNGKLDKTFETIRCELGFRHKLQQYIVTSLRDKSWWKILYLFSFKLNETHCILDIVWREYIANGSFSFVFLLKSLTFDAPWK